MFLLPQFAAEAAQPFLSVSRAQADRGGRVVRSPAVNQNRSKPEYLGVSLPISLAGGSRVENSFLDFRFRLTGLLHASQEALPQVRGHRPERPAAIVMNQIGIVPATSQVE
jgi:hypothetical protein